MVAGYMIDVIPLGILLLFIFIIIDCFRHKVANLLNRVLFYSFLFYLLFTFHYTTGYFHYPPREVGTLIFQLVPFQFTFDLLNIYQLRGLDWFFWSIVRINFNNLIMLLPLGIYLAVLFNKKTLKNVALIILSVSCDRSTLLDEKRPIKLDVNCYKMVLR
jgi:hypothetical protein